MTFNQLILELQSSYTPNMAAKASKSIEPSPVVGSQPAVALKPEVQHVADALKSPFAQQLLYPLVTSLKDAYAHQMLSTITIFRMSTNTYRVCIESGVHIPNTGQTSSCSQGVHK
jgi:hypothetical protein